MPDSVPLLRSVVVDTTDARSLAEFYRQLLGYRYRPGDEPSAEPDEHPDWGVTSWCNELRQLRDERRASPAIPSYRMVLSKGRQ